MRAKPLRWFYDSYVFLAEDGETPRDQVMSMKKTFLGLLATALLVGSAQADNPKVQRSVGSDGVPTITIHSKAPAAPAQPVEVEPVETEPAKEFKVYDLGDSGEAPQSESAPKIIVISSPPPIPVNPGAFNYGFGFGTFPFGVGLFNGFAGRGFVPAGPLFPRIPGPAAPINYQNPPVNYQNPIINYQNPVPGGLRAVTPQRRFP